MKQKGQTLYFITSLLLLIGIFIILFLYFNDKHTKQLTSTKNSFIIADNTLMTNMIDANKNLGYKINNLTLKDTLNGKIKLKDIVKDKNILIYRIAYSNCSSCIVSGLNSLLKNTYKIPFNKIIIIGSFYNTKELTKFINKNNINFKIYNLKQSIDLPAEEFDIPYFMVLSKDLTVMSCFFPEKANPKYTDYFFSGIEHFFINK
ncbi:MAG: hypothetical protein B6D61_13550 [Bacteroidetes bacterium 4484_249]|nr:MAG: hypothetical protein B6D61_13550 [Bacteroidetes bacterium 4484_249]